MQLLCPNCAKPIPAEDVVSELGIAKCTACNAVFHVLDELHRPAEKPHIGLPRRFTVEDWGPEVTIRWRWFNHSFWFLLCFCLFWDGVLFFVYAAARHRALERQARMGCAGAALVSHLPFGGRLGTRLLVALFAAQSNANSHFGRRAERSSRPALFGPATANSRRPMSSNCFAKKTSLKAREVIPLLTMSWCCDRTTRATRSSRDSARSTRLYSLNREIEPPHLKIPDRPVPGEVRY